MEMDACLVREIDGKLDKVVQDPDYYLKRDHRIRHSFDTALKTFVWWVQHPDLNAGFPVVGNGNKGIVIKRAREGIENLSESWRYISQQKDFLNEDVFLELGNVVDPNLNSNGYRQNTVSLGMDDYTPPNPVKVPELVEETFREARESNSITVEKAAMLHLRLAGIQPFPSGNKRVARLYQDRALFESGLPPACISNGERRTYLSLLQRGLVDLRDCSSDGVKEFINYIGGKVNSFLDEILYDLKIAN